MLTKQIIVSALGLGLVVLLYNFPKYVVENEKEETAGQIMQENSSEAKVTHGTELTFEQA